VRLWPAEVVREDYRDKSVPLLERRIMAKEGFATAEPSDEE
jgi:hypothetical protein